MTGAAEPGQPRQAWIVRALLASADRGVAFPPALREGDARDQQILGLARHHRLSPLLAASAPDGFSAAMMEIFRRDRLATLGRATLFRHALQALLASFDGAGVEVAVLKGLAYETLLYDQPGTRPASDIDLLVRPEDRQRSFAALARLGYAPYASAPGFDEPDYHEVSFRLREITVDLHFALAPLARCRVDYPDLWSRMQDLDLDGRRTRTLGFVDAALNQALHMAIHHFDVPASYLLDFCRLLERSEPSALPRLRATARAWQCVRALETTVALARAFLPHATPWPLGDDLGDGAAGLIARRVVRAFGGRAPVSRPEQWLRKLTHLDDAGVVVRYLGVQARRNLRERWLGWSGDSRSATTRLGMTDDSP